MPSDLGFGDVVNDYCACHAVKPDVKALCEAIIVAVDHGNDVFYISISLLQYLVMLSYVCDCMRV